MKLFSWVSILLLCSPSMVSGQGKVTFHKYLKLDKEVSQHRARFRHTVTTNGWNMQREWFDVVNNCLRSRKVFDRYNNPTGIWVLFESQCQNGDTLDFRAIRYTSPEEKLTIDSVEHKGLVLPTYELGERILFKHLSYSLDYPRIAYRNGIQGTVYVTFNVQIDGSLSDIEIIQGAHPYLDLEAFRVVSELPNGWNPATLNRKPIVKRMNLPIVFKLK